MTSKSTLVGKCILILTIFTLSTFFSSKAQVAMPKLKFIQPHLVSGVDGEKKAVYKFDNVVDGVDAFVEIKKIKNGAILKNIDDSTFGYYDAWQPTVGGPSTVGTSSIEWEISFKTSDGADYTFTVMDLSAIDIDGDNVKVREFIDMKGYSSYDVPTQIPSLLDMTVINDDDDEKGDVKTVEGSVKNATKLHILGPVINRTNIDTTSLDVKVNFHFDNQKTITVTTGSQIDDNGYTGALATDRFNSLYFKTISNSISKVLGVKYSSFDAYALNNTTNITWTTDSETNNDHFEVERSFDQKDFKTIGLVFGAEGNVSTTSKYSFSDKAKDLSSHKVIYYRLKQIDFDGKVTYSVVKMVRFGSDTKISVQVFPNPYTQTINVNFASEENGKAEVRMINTKGQVVAKSQSLIGKGYNKLQLTDLSTQLAGLYIVDVIVNGKVVDTQKVIKQ
ncbi:MAG: T9SS type A sorting domain-containing protein [Bacteroidota bacterium]|nr:T9SS type A sorting domain-containing protein [Bacteroidota bacterium]